MAIRWSLVGIILAPFVKPPRGHWKDIALVSITLGFLHFAIMYIGLKDLDAATAVIAAQLQVPFAALLAAIVFKDRLGWRRALGMALSFVGVAIIAGEPRMADSFVPLALVIGAACIWSVANIQIKLLGEVSGFTLNAWVGVFAGPQLALASYLFEDGQAAALAAADWRAMLAMAYQVIVAVIVGFSGWYWLLRRYTVNQVMPFMLLTPGFGVLAGVVMLGEPLTLTLIVGGMLTVLGVAAITVSRPKLVAPAAERV
jgi:O-acetylserine/cysteine efflux transporter